jgi:hypothetical protein
MKLFFLLPVIFFIQNEVPFKPADEFQVNIDLKFKEKPPAYGANTFTPTGERLDTQNTSMLPFLEVSVTNLKIREDEVRIVAVNSMGKQLLRKKASPAPDIRFVMGFIDDLKSTNSANEITVFFVSAEKKELRKIVLKVLPTGVFQVNGEWRGQF